MSTDTDILSQEEYAEVGAKMLSLHNSFPHRQWKRIDAHDAALRAALQAAQEEARIANEALGRTVSVAIGTSVLTRDLVWCGGCARGLSITGNWYHCPQCGGKIDQESYRQACTEAIRNGNNIARYVSGEGSDRIKALEAELAAEREINRELKADAEALKTVIFLDGLSTGDFAKFHAAKITYCGSTGADVAEPYIATYLANLLRAAEALGWQYASVEFKGGRWRFSGGVDAEVVRLRERMAVAERERDEARKDRGNVLDFIALDAAMQAPPVKE